MTDEDHPLVMQHGDLRRSFRKPIYQYFMESMVKSKHINVQDADAVQLLRDFCLRPDNELGKYTNY